MKGLYALLLHLFPRAYREEYGEELQAVFELSLDDAMELGGLEIARVALRELSSLPKAIIYEHLRERRKARMIGKFSSWFDFAPGSGWEFLSAIYPFFLLGGVLPIINMISLSGVMRFPNLLFNGIAIVLLAVLGILCLIGLAKGLPRWSLSYIGFTSVLISMMASPSVLRSIQRWFPRHYQQFASLGGISYENIWWFGLLVVVTLFLVLTWNVSVFRRFRDDWTLPCFIVYGGVPFGLLFTFEEYRWKEPFMLLAFVVMAWGAWSYMHGRDEWKRFAALFGGLTIAMFIAAAGKAILLPVQDWPIHLDPDSWKSEAMGTIITWLWLALIMLVPLAVKLLPRADVSSHPGLPEG